MSVLALAAVLTGVLVFTCILVVGIFLGLSDPESE